MKCGPEMWTFGTDIFKSYCLSRSITKKPKSERSFLFALTKIHPVEVSKRRLNGKHKTAYRGIAVSPDAEDEFTEVSLHQVAHGLAKKWGCVHTGDCLTATINTRSVVDGKQVKKEVTISQKGKLTCIVDGREVKLSDAGIVDTTRLTLKDIEATLKVIDKLQVCHGYEMPGASVWSIQGDENSSKSSERSGTCIGLVSLTKKGNTCDHCLQRGRLIKWRSQPAQRTKQATAKEKTEHLETVLKEMDLTEDLSQFLLEQAANTLLPPVRRRWSPK